MKSFIEQLISRNFDLSDEILTIEHLLNEKSLYDPTLYTMIDARFRKWKHRKNLISLRDLYEKMGIDTIVSNANQNNICLNEYIFYAECMVNIINIPNLNDLYTFNRETWMVINDNLNNVIEQLNYEIRYFKSEQYFKIIIKDWKVSESAEIIQDTYNLGEKIYLYNHHSLKGKLFEKADILCRLYKVFESGKESTLKSNQFTALASDIGFLSDKLDVRHAPNRQQKVLLDGLTKSEQESLYDDLFNLYLDMLILCEHIEKRKDIKELSKKLASIKP